MAAVEGYCMQNGFSSLLFGVKLAQGFLAAGGGAGRPEMQLDLAARSFLVFIKILWLSFGIAPLAMTPLELVVLFSQLHTPIKSQWP